MKTTQETIVAMLDRIAIPRDEALHQQLCYGGVMSEAEALLRIDMRCAKVEVMNRASRSICRYQRKQGVSALYWGKIEYCGRSLRICRINPMLTPTKADVQELRRNKWEIIAFLADIQAYFKTWIWDKNKPDYEEWQERGWAIALESLKQCQWLHFHFTDFISEVLALETGEKYERPDTHFAIYGFEKHPAYDYTSEGCEFWMQLNNSKPSY